MVIDSHDEPEGLSSIQRGQQSLTNADSTLISLIIFLQFSKSSQSWNCVWKFFIFNIDNILRNFKKL